MPADRVTLPQFCSDFWATSLKSWTVIGKWMLQAAKDSNVSHRMKNLPALGWRDTWAFVGRKGGAGTIGIHPVVFRAWEEQNSRRWGGIGVRAELVLVGWMKLGQEMGRRSSTRAWI